METRSPDSELSTVASSDYFKARHFLVLLLRLGRPARPPVLASLCTLFPASPELIHYLCSIPNSPISLTGDLYVIPSPVASRAFIESGAIANFFNALLRPPSQQFVTGFCDTNSVGLRLKKRKWLVSDYEFVPSAKRRLILNTEDAKEENRSPLQLEYASPKVSFHFQVTDYVSRSINTIPCSMLKMATEFNFANHLSCISNARQRSCQLTEIRLLEGESDTTVSMKSKGNEEAMEFKPSLELVLPTSILDNLTVSGGTVEDGDTVGIRTNCVATLCPDDIEEINMPMMEVGNANESFIASNIEINEKEGTMGGQEEARSVASGSIFGETENVCLQLHTIPLNVPCGSGGTKNVDFEDMMPSFDKEHIYMESCDLLPKVLSQKRLSKHEKATEGISPRQNHLCKSVEHGKAIDVQKEKHQIKRDCKVIDKRRKLGQNIEKKRSSNVASPKDQMEEKILPNFETYVAEEEEGSGGYGTVYRARSKKDGTTVAIKCPHVNAHKHHVDNELRMLERFGGKSFVIKYEGSVKNGDSDCFVLEHVEHDRPEVLKNEINIFQLQWYGYCMFRALSSLHKQGVIHRDVKPGNFLFSRKASKGYLIDFNLAMDLHQKYGNTGKSKVGCNAHTDQVKLPNTSSALTKDRKLPNTKSSETARLKTTNDYKSTLGMKNIRRKALTQTKTRNNDLGGWNVSKSQGADGSGITSADRLREPLPCQGRKELINLAQEARQSINHESSTVLSPMRKRIAAPPQNVDKTLVYLNPMPLVSTGIGAGSSHLMNRGNRKIKKEGHCVGTKGFRAPEVLLRSPYQCPKIDIWSAGVTILYLMVGRTPFFGDPEQNMKDIAKLRGSEDLWEVAKLHNREPSFPEDLYKLESLPSIKLEDWCEMSSKRPNFLKDIPKSLFDLVDKCLTVNPRLRISAEEALKHEFFDPCHEALRKLRLQRQDSESSSSSRGKSVLKPIKISQVKA
ncbi:uncharacterized protein LOC133778073 [Humulus lupulus]|uniref:uncharacterized protein LOC133778073 n=1 Tax=Humulus lupulus TaxID=3486 RepID=UPI002B409641|nr:uncharacterized protein LOC133778073 [Humulus lupulus]